jgi:hypothetical protein
MDIGLRGVKKSKGYLHNFTYIKRISIVIIVKNCCYLYRIALFFVHTFYVESLSGCTKIALGIMVIWYLHKKDAKIKKRRFYSPPGLIFDRLNKV